MPTASKRVEPADTKASLYVATETGSASVGGEEFYFKRGQTHVRAGHRLLRACPQYFQLAEERVDYDVESATANPGEKRA